MCPHAEAFSGPDRTSNTTNSFVRLGATYTMVKGCDHELVRALETHMKAVPWKINIEICMVAGLQVQL